MTGTGESAGLDPGTGLARYLSDMRGRAVRVTIDGLASAGARRQNVLFSVSGDDDQPSERLVATIVPNAALQIQDFMIEPTALVVAEAHAVPVAHMVGATTDESYVGGPFFITRRVDGETVPRRLLRLVESTGVGSRLVEQCGHAMAALHRVPLPEAPEALVRPEGLVSEAAIVALDASLGELLQPSPVFALALRWLERHVPPAEAAPALVHGDFRNGNIIVGDDGLRAVLDWEGVRISDPMEDPAWICVRMWRFGNDKREVGGFGDRAQLAAAYTAAGGRWDDDWFDWWQILGTMRWGVGLARQAMAHLDGSVPSVVMAASGRRVAEQEFDLLTLLRPHLPAS